MPKIFVSYCHQQRDWVWRRLVPVLKAAGAEVLIDVERFKAGVGCFKQMDAEQDAADTQLLCFSKDYLQSNYCHHEWRRAVRIDPHFDTGRVVPLVLTPATQLPKAVRVPKPLYVEMRDDHDPTIWGLLLKSLRLDWSCCPVSWLNAAEEVTRRIWNGECVNLLVPRLANNGHRQPVDSLITHLQSATYPSALLPKLQLLDLHEGECATLPGLLGRILAKAGIQHALPSNKANALVDFSQKMRTVNSPLQLMLRSADIIGTETRQKAYGENLFAALFNLTHPTNKRLSLFVVSHRPWASLTPAIPSVSAIPFTTLELDAK